MARGEMARQTREQLQRLVAIWPEVKLHLLSRGGAEPTERRAIHPAGIHLAEVEPEPWEPLPAVEVVHLGRRVTLDFSPAESPDTYWMNFWVAAHSPFKFTITWRDTRHFQGVSRGVAMQPVRVDDEAFSRKYDVMSVDAEWAERFLSVPANRQLFLDMGEIERFTVADRYLRLTRLLDEFSDIEAEKGLKRTLQKLAELAITIEERFASTPRN